MLDGQPQVRVQLVWFHQRGSH